MFACLEALNISLFLYDFSRRPAERCIPVISKTLQINELHTLKNVSYNLYYVKQDKINKSQSKLASILNNLFVFIIFAIV